MTAQADF